MRALVLLALAGCWHGKTAEPESTAAPAPIPAKRAGRPAPPGPPLTSYSPGPLSTAHAAWDDEVGCLTCHLQVGQTAPLSNARCIGCHDHDDIAKQLSTRQGLHAGKARAGSCQTCHREHKGRGHDMRGWQTWPGGETHFDHAVLGWTVPAKYGNLSCFNCHVRQDWAGRTLYLGLDRALFP